MVMEPAEQPSRRDRSIKSGRVSIRRGEEFCQEGIGQPRQGQCQYDEETCLRNGKLMHSFLEYGTESRHHSRLKKHVFEERKTRAQLLGMKI
jgi:hypothetical protein